MLVRAIPDKTNLKWSVRERPENWRSLLDPIIANIRTKGILGERVLIVCNDADLKRHSEIYSYLKSELGDQVYDRLGRPMVTAYHSKSSQDNKDMIERSLTDLHGHVRVVVVSSAMGRGANYPGITKVLFLQCPLSLEEAYQGGGRGGRDTDQQAEAIIYYVNSDIPSNRAAKSLREFVHLGPDDCRRQFGLRYFRFPGDPEPQRGNHHRCCDLCQARCTCSLCHPSSPSQKRGATSILDAERPLKRVSPEPSPVSLKRSRSPEPVQTVVVTESPSVLNKRFRTRLLTLFDSLLEQEDLGLTTTLLTDEIIDQLVTDRELLTSKMTLIVEYEFGSIDAQRVWDIIASL